MTPIEFAKDYIFTQEDRSSHDPKITHSMDRNDPGNWTEATLGKGVLVGSNHGVTSKILADFRGVKSSDITVAMMHSLTLDEAASIAIKTFYHVPKLDLLPWNAVIASVMDFGWTAGPGHAIKMLQKMLSLPQDGHISPSVAEAFAKFMSTRSLEVAAGYWAGTRNEYYDSLNKPQYIKGWKNRTAYFTPGTTWWKKFNS